VRFLPLDQPRGDALYEDEENWEVPAEPKATETSLPLMGKEKELETTFSKDN
jgi:hypothetical protein